MTVADRIDPVYRRWVAPVVVAEHKTYVGRHRRSGWTMFSVWRMFYRARHFSREN
jgi:hypothetical protein